MKFRYTSIDSHLHGSMVDCLLIIVHNCTLSVGPGADETGGPDFGRGARLVAEWWSEGQAHTRKVLTVLRGLNKVNFMGTSHLEINISNKF